MNGWIGFILFALLISAPVIFCIALLHSKTTYYVVYKRIGFCVEILACYVKARGLADVQRQLEAKHDPWNIVILSIKEAG